MAAEVIAAWIAAGASLASAGTAWFAQRQAARVAAAADRQTTIVAAKTDVYNSDKSIYVEQITAERAVWRSELRTHMASLAEELCKDRPDHGTVVGLTSQIMLRLNPAGFSDDPADRLAHPRDAAIVACLLALRARTATDGGAALEREVARLLKQEWEKSKTEANRATLT